MCELRIHPPPMRLAVIIVDVKFSLQGACSPTRAAHVSRRARGRGATRTSLVVMRD